MVTMNLKFWCVLNDHLWQLNLMIIYGFGVLMFKSQKQNQKIYKGKWHKRFQGARWPWPKYSCNKMEAIIIELFYHSPWWELDNMCGYRYLVVYVYTCVDGFFFFFFFLVPLFFLLLPCSIILHPLVVWT